MTEIHIEQSEPETGWWRINFALSEGQFSKEVLAAVRRATGGVGHFGDKNPANLTLVYQHRYHIREGAAWATLKVLKQLCPDTTFTTYADNIKTMFGDEVVQITHKRQ